MQMELHRKAYFLFIDVSKFMSWPCVCISSWKRLKGACKSIAGPLKPMEHYFPLQTSYCQACRAYYQVWTKPYLPTWFVACIFVYCKIIAQRIIKFILVFILFIAKVSTTNMTAIERDADGNVFYGAHMTTEDTLNFYKRYAETYDHVKFFIIIWE